MGITSKDTALGIERRSSLLPEIKSSLFGNHSSSQYKNGTPMYIKGINNTPMNINGINKSIFAETPPLSDTPNLSMPLSDTQINELLDKVNMSNVFLNMANNDQDLIFLMKDTIEYQRAFATKREKLVHAITHNVEYLAAIHKKNNNDLKQTKEHLAAVLKWNEKLQEDNHELNKSNSALKHDQEELAKKRDEINKMVIDSQANKLEIEQLH